MRTNLLLAASLFTVATLAVAQQTTLPLWPQGTPEPWNVSGTEKETTRAAEYLTAGKSVLLLSNIATPTLAVYRPQKAPGTGAAVVVFPGGGYSVLAYDLEGTEVCDWLNSIGVTCVLVKYRVPVEKRYPETNIDLEDAQQAMHLTRTHAAEWQIDPQRIGVLGFSAGAHLAAVLSNHADFAQPGMPANAIDAHPDFAILIYPAYLATPSGDANAAPLAGLTPGQEPNARTPPTFLLQAEDDPVHEENALYYFQALKVLKVPAELHLFAQGGHGYGLRPTELPVTHWPSLVETWFHTIHVLGGPAATAR